MLDSDEKITAFLVQLNKLTSLGRMQWEVTEVPASILRGTDDCIPVFMAVTYKGKRFGLFQQRYQLYDGNHDRHYWIDRILFVILSYDDKVLWATTTHSSALNDLFETVRRKVADVDGVIDEILSDT